MTFHVYALGDSVMWGQGLKRSDTFASIVARTLASEQGESAQLTVLAHSGAKMFASQSERQAFESLYPALFDNTERAAFLSPVTGQEPDETPSTKLHGEIPRIFPTTDFQIRSVPEAEGKRADLVLIDGGANDLDFAAFLAETEADELTDTDSQLKELAYASVLRLLRSARNRFPNALIVLTGYYAPLSFQDDQDRQKEFLLDQDSDKAFWYRTTQSLRLIPILYLTPLFFIPILTEDKFEEKRRAVIHASEFGEAHLLHWLCKAVSDVNGHPELHDIRGPGVVFVAPAFGVTNTLFGAESLLWNDYELEELQDDLRTQRRQGCPREVHYDAMKKIARHLGPESQSIVSRKSIQALHDSLLVEGPVDLVTSLGQLASNPSDTRLRAQVWDLLWLDIDRIDHIRIASFFHPNIRGAQQYASRVSKRIREHAGTLSVRKRLDSFQPQSERNNQNSLIGIRPLLTRYGLNPATGLRVCLSHAEPDVLAFEIVLRNKQGISDQPFHLQLGDTDMGVVHPRVHDLRAFAGDTVILAKSEFFAIDVAGRLRIRDLNNLFLVHGNGQGIWHPASITLFIDGIKTDVQRFSGGQSARIRVLPNSTGIPGFV